MMIFVPLAFVGLASMLVGYSVAFASGGGTIGGMRFLLLANVGLNAQGSIPHVLFAAYQGTFAIITAALISRAIVARRRFGPYLAFFTFWSIFVYPPLSHCSCAGGLLHALSARDVAI